MRRTLVPALLLALTAACLDIGADRPPGGAGAEEPTRTIRLELDRPADGRFAFENLVGTLTVRPGTGGKIVAVATVHAARAEMADLIRLEQAAGEEGEPLIRVVYPVEEHRSYKYGENPRTDFNWVNLFGGAGTTTRVDYGGAQVTVSDGKGVPLHVDVEMSLPDSDLSATFLNVVGLIRASGVSGNLGFSNYSGILELNDVGGQVKASAFSGDVRIAGRCGSVTCETASGDIFVEDFEGSELKCSTSSGAIRVAGASSEKLRFSTASGDIDLGGLSAARVSAATASGDIDAAGEILDSFDASTATGDVSLRTSSHELKRIKVGTARGDIDLLLPPSISFEARADIGHGEIENAFEDAEPILEGGAIVGYRRGDGSTKIDVNAVHGRLVIARGE